MSKEHQKHSHKTEEDIKKEEKSETSAEEKTSSEPAEKKQEENSEQKEEKKETNFEEEISKLKKENADLKDQLLRRAADFENDRKRMIKEKQDTADYANANLLSDLLESLDNFDRTVEAADTAKDAKAIADGVKMINKNLVSMLENKYNLVSYGKEGDVFNPDEHEAIGRVEDENAKEETLKQVYLKGYKLKERIIRHAKVLVSVPKNK